MGGAIEALDSFPLPLSEAAGRMPSRVFHFSPDVFFVSLSSILVLRMEELEVLGSMGP